MIEILIMIIAVLFAALILSTIFIIRYRRQIREVCRQLSFHIQNRTNQDIRVDVRSKEILNLQEDINEIFDQYKALEKQYKMSDDNMKNMITNISHDIRTPLTSINGYFQLLSETKDEEEKQKYTKIIRNRIDSLSTLLEQLFLYVRVQNSELKLTSEKCDVKQKLCEALFSFYDDFKQKSMEPTVELTEENCISLLDSSMLTRIFQNILKNAMVHGEKEIKVVLYKENRLIHLTIGNYTKEAHPSNPEAVFERFYQGDASRNNQSTGLGLSIAKELVEKMKGTIRASYIQNYFELEIVFKESIN